MKNRTAIIVIPDPILYNANCIPIGVDNNSDLCLAADAMRFIANPITLAEVDDKCDANISGWFRNMRRIVGDECIRIVRLLKSYPDATSNYIDEIDRLERFNLKHGGYRYFHRRQTEKFSWDLAKQYLG
jgi:hypothetical protein